MPPAARGSLAGPHGEQQEETRGELPPRGWRVRAGGARGVVEVPANGRVGSAVKPHRAACQIGRRSFEGSPRCSHWLPRPGPVARHVLSFLEGEKRWRAAEPAWGQGWDHRRRGGVEVAFARLGVGVFWRLSRRSAVDSFGKREGIVLKLPKRERIVLKLPWKFH